MLKSIQLSAVLLVALALPALAQTAAPSTPAPASRTPSFLSHRSSTAPASPTSAAPASPANPAPATTTPYTRAARPAAAPATATTSPTATAAANKIDINAATEPQLDALPGIGPVLAGHIIAGRPWDDLNDLVKKKALPQGVFDRNKDRFALANINTSSAADLAKTLPGIGEVRSRAIVSGRPYTAPDDLVSKKVLTQNQYDKIKDLIAF